MSAAPNEPIAIIGSGCRFPGESSSPSKLWELLREPRDVLQRIPIERFNTSGVYNPDGMYHGSTNVRESYLLSEDYRHFDARFFKINPVEAHSMDPQQRLLLETVYEALESAGQPIAPLRGSNTAVYVGLMSEEYGEILSRDVDYLPTYFPTATARSIMSNRISYVFDWHGPCMTIDTACSSSLVAVHQAVQTLRNGDSRMAVAAGSNLCLGSKPYISENKLNMLSPRSRSSMWDEAADGYARGDGVATLVLKTLSRALEDGDNIECLIRESGVNQDGRTQGITMPSQVSQEVLIRETYTKAGLDISKRSDRPQFFEAHGTGTPAGDPIEAEAIHNSFFRFVDRCETQDVGDTLYVGSIKTVIGHTEGTAGIAAVMKASLGMQNSVVPPNLLFNKLSPKVAPFYGKVKITTSALPWPSVPEGQPKRTSVNSFGFGGTNAHVILESYEPHHGYGNQMGNKAVAFLPFTFSAASEKSLASSIGTFAQYLRDNKSIDLADLAYTLNFKRSAFAFRRSFSATTVDTLLSKMDDVIAKSDPVATVGANPTKCKILGVFTGQGAQWPTMGRELLQGSAFVRKIVEKLQSALDNLPIGDRPNWSLTGELLADSSHSRLNKALVSQTLCTVVQVILVDLLRLAGIQFDAVVGHSSGEIGAAYAAGYISAEDAVKIAYYRGIHSAAACGPPGRQGAMLAVGTSLEDAQQLCDLEDLSGRISVAACNSSSSVTLSGDADAVDEVVLAMEAEGKFARRLKVDTAYHSHHMLPCAGPYMRSLDSCDIKIRSPSHSSCAWFSSVTGKEMDPDDASLLSTYWSDNMTGRVNFAQAIEAALERNRSFGLAFEVGPHPALRGPALQTSQDINPVAIPYSGTLERGKNDIEAFADTLGFALSYIPEDILTLQKFVNVVAPGHEPTPLKGLPPYAWEHDRAYWMETRLARAFRTRDRPVHQLLGTISHDGSNRELRWRNVLSPNEIPWLQGHRLQGQIVFPGSAYVSMAIEAARICISGQNIRLLEISDLVMGKAMVFENEQSTADVQFTLRVENRSNDRLQASFYLEGTTNQDSDDLATYCTGKLAVDYGAAEFGILPARGPPLVDTVPVDKDIFYTSLLPIGYEYSGDFRALMEMRRTTDAGTALIRQRPNDETSSLLVHPGVLDCAIQAVILALSWPGDNRLWSLHVPAKIHRLKLNPALLEASSDPQTLLPVEASVTSLGSSAFWGEVGCYAADSLDAVMQLEGVEIVPFTAGSPETDVELFFDIRWDVASPQGDMITRGERATEKEKELATLCERVAYFYLRTLSEDISEDEWSSAEWYFRQLKKFSDHSITEIESGRHPHIDKAWKHDTREQIYAEMAKWPDNIDLRLMRSVGENLVPTIRGKTTILEHMMDDNVLNDFYVQGLGLDKYTCFLSNSVMQLAHRYANMNILEIGAGTGGVTKTIIKQLGRAFNSYTYTDISSGFFEKAQNTFREYSDRMVFKTLDVEKDPVAQGFQEHTYDLVICSLVLHATEDLESTLKNVRRLLTPGGYLAMMEITNTEAIRIGFSMGGLPGWWLGYRDDRELNPCVPADRWDAELLKSGFSGIDTITPPVDVHAWLFSIILAQATDDRVSFLQHPLSAKIPETGLGQLTLLGGGTTATANFAEILQSILQPYYERIVCIDSVEKFDPNESPESTSVLSLTDLDTPVLKNVTGSRLAGLRRLFEQSRCVLWITKGARSEDPYAAMIIGFGRTLTMEMPNVRLQFLHHEGGQEPRAEKVAETLLRLQATDGWQQEEADTKMLWTPEPEVTIDQDRTLIPRLYASSELNDRYNSGTRPVTKLLDLPSSVAGLVPTKSGYDAIELPRKADAQDSQDDSLVTIRPSRSLSLAIRISVDNCLFLAEGTALETGEWVIAALPELASEVVVARDWVIPSDPPTAQESEKLVSLGINMLSRYIVGRRTASETTLLVHEASPMIAHAVAQRAAEKGVTCVFTTTHSPSNIPQATYIHPHSTLGSIRASLPAGVGTFVDLSTNKTVGSIVASALPQKCLKLDFEHLFSSSAFYSGEQGDVSVNSLLNTAYQCHNAVFERLADRVEANTVLLSEIDNSSDLDNSCRIGKVIDWTVQTVPVAVTPVDTNLSFRPDRTYLLFGLSGQLGRSLALYMVRFGAKYIVLTSRKPDVDDTWLERARELGAHVRVAANDITDREAVRALVADIRGTMPPVAGVANGAMVLQDTAITQMTSEIMNRVLSPKVNGSRYLDELFQDADLDFFVMFSSIATICGQHGQSNYTAANMFLNGLAAQRQRRGLVGSVMAIGAIMGIGYFSREVDETTRNRVIESGYRMMSERDFHLLFVETVRAGHPDRGNTHEVITGLRKIEDEDRHASNPLFHHVVTRKGGANVLDQDSAVRIPLTAQIAAATSEDEVYECIKDSFSHKLQVILQLDQTPSEDAGGEELGIDSLVAVEIRTWFLNELAVDISVLKILGGATIRGMVELAMEKLPTGSARGITGEAASTPDDPVTGSDQTPENDHSESTPLTAPSNSGDSTKNNGLTTNSDFLSTVDEGLARKELMSYGQQRFWFLGAMLEDQTAFNIVFVIQLAGVIDIEKLESALRKITHRHSALRTRFVHSEEGEAMQEVLAAPSLQLEHRNIGSRDEVSKEFERLKNHVYDLENGDVMQISLLSQSPNLHFLAVGYHHINMDFVALQVFLKDLDKAYRGLPLNQGVLQYPDYAARQRTEFQRGKMNRELSYWKNEFPDFPPVLPLLPFAKVRSRQPRTSYAHNRVDIKMQPNVTASVKAACTKYKVSPFHFHLAAFKALLVRFLSVDDLCIGMTDANRKDLDELDSVGLFLNTLPLRFRQQAGQLFSDSMKEAQSKVRNALANSRLPFDVMIDQLKPERSTEYSPIFQAFIDYKPPVDDKPDLFECTLGEERYEVGQTAYDIGLSIVDDVKDPAVIFHVQSCLYTQEEATILTKSYMWLLEQFASDPESTLNKVTLHSPADVEGALQVGRGPVVTRKWQDTISHRVKQIIDDYGKSPAVIDCSGMSFSYKELDTRINAVALNLRKHRIGHGSRIAVLQEPGIDWVSSLLATLKVGGIYVPLDFESPAGRLEEIISDSKAESVLIHSATLKHARRLGCRNVMFMDVSSLEIDDQTTVEILPEVNSPAFLFFTSGTTGKPKGALLKHPGVCNQIEYAAKTFDSGPGSVTLLQTAPTFDLSISQVFQPLATGGCLLVASSSQRRDPSALVDLIVTRKVSCTFATPSEYAWWLQCDTGNRLKESHWSTAVAGGEVFPPSLNQAFESLQKPGLRVFNAYGPCEATMCTNMFHVDYSRATEGIPIGRAIQNTANYIVDEDLNGLPIGMPGEIVLGGAGIAEGYVNNEEQTRARFLPDAFASREFVDRGWTTMYRTGDRGRMFGDGTVVAEGRISGDTEVKIRGQRIELQDVERNLIQTARGDLTEAVVSARGGSAGFLVAHVTFAKGKTPADQKNYYRNLVAELPLPQYMRPSLVVPIDKLPVTKHFKLDRQAISRLPLPDVVSEDGGEDDNMSETARKMRDAWQKVLPKDTAKSHVLDDNADFFHVGGNSMRLYTLRREIKREFEILFPLPKLFERSTLGQMVDMIQPKEEDEEPKVEVDWATETAVGPAPTRVVVSRNRRPKNSVAKAVALTGSTGFLGRRILRQLVEDSTISHVHCIAVRGDSSSRSLPSQFASPKVTVHYGDLTDTDLGLAQTHVDEIFDTIDLIIHNAADVSFMKTYHSLKPINFETTKEIVRLASSRRIPIHYISTAGVAHLSGRTEYPEITASAHFPPTDGSDGYTASKWASEVYLENASKAYDLPVWIHRPSSIMGDDPAPTDMMANMLKFSLSMRAVPLLQGEGEGGEPSAGLEDGFLDMIDVENVAGGILASLRGGDDNDQGAAGAAGASVKYVHHAGEMVIPMNSLGGKSSSSNDENGGSGLGLGFEMLTLPDWTARAKEQGLNELVAEFLSTAEDGVRDRARDLGAFFMYPRLLKGSSS